MNNIRASEKILKHNLKNKRSITLSLIVSFLITGGLGFFEDDKIYARDLRVRNSGGNDIRPDSGGPNLSKSINDTDVVNIVNPNEGGISHNKFIDFSVGTDGVIFNNNSTGAPTVTKIGGIVTQNPNLTTSASTILSEVTGNRGSSINGVVEIAGQRADFILANENGISVNGGGFINTNGVTLTTGRPTVSGNNIDLNVQNGNVTIDGKGVGTAGNYFNIIAKTIELKGQIAPFDGEKDADINLIAGQNRVSIADRSSPIVKEVIGNDKGDKKYGIYANHLGAMYGKNIKLISTTQGLGVKHEGLVKSTGDISISSNGDIVVGGLLSEKSIDIKGTGNFNTINSSFKNSGVESNFSITAGDGINLEVAGDIIIESVIQAEKTGIKIVGKNLTMKTQTTAKILSQKGLTIKLTGNMNVEELLVPVMAGRDPKLPALVVLNENGRVVVKDPVTGRIIQSNELTWETTGIFGENIDIEAGNLINNALIQTGTKDSKNTINIKVANQLTNKKIISSSGNLNIDSNRLQNESGAVIKGGTVKIVSNNIKNAGELRQNVGSLGETAQRAGNIVIDIKNGRFENTGLVSGYNVNIVGSGFILNEKNGRIEASTQDYPQGLGTISINVRNLENKGVIQSYGKGIQNNITINTETLINHFGGKIVAQKGSLVVTTTVGDLLNSGEFFADKNVTLKSQKDFKTSGKIGGENISITAEGNFENYGKIAAVKELIVNVNDLINAGTPEEISKYLTAFNRYIKENYENVLKIIEGLEERISQEVDPSVIKGLEETLSYYKSLEIELATLNFEIEKVGSLGIMSGEKVDLVAKGNLANKGIVKSKTDISVSAEKGITNNGILEADNDISLSTKGDIKNTQRIYAKNNLNISGKSFTSTGNEELLKEYADIVSQYDEKALDESIKKIQELEKLLQAETDTKKIAQLKAELTKYREVKKIQSELKAKAVIVLGLGSIESGNISITTTEAIKNSGIIITDKNLNMTSGGDIENSGNISVGGDAKLKGESFINKDMSVVGTFNGEFKSKVESDTLKVQKDIELTAKEINITKELSSGGNLGANIVSNGSGINIGDIAKLNVKGNVTVKGGGIANSGEVLIGENLSVNQNGNSNAKVKNLGSIDVGKDVTINANDFENNGSFKAGNKLEIDANNGDILNKGDLQSGKGGSLKGNSLKNTGTSIFGGDLSIETGAGGVENNSLEVSGDIAIKSSGDITSSNKLQNTGKLTVSGKNISNKGVILNNGASITAEGNLTNEGSIEATGELSLISDGEFLNSGEIKGTKNGEIKGKSKVENTGLISLGENLNIEGGTVLNSKTGKLSSAGDLDITYNNKFSNSGEIVGDNINIHQKSAADSLFSQNSESFTNEGKINANSNLLIKDIGNQKDININGNGDYSANKNITVETGGNINVKGKFQNKGDIKLSAGKDITNSAMIVSAGDISLKAQNLINEVASTIWAGRNMVIDVINQIHNKLLATIESKGDMGLTATHVINDAGIIKSGGNLDITTDKLENRSVVEGTGFKQVSEYIATERYKYEWIGVNKYSVVELVMPIFESDYIVKNKALIQSGGNLNIKGKSKEKSNVHNFSGTISSKKNMSIIGDLKNETASAQMSADEYLSKIQIRLKYELKTVGDAPLNSWYIDGGTGSLLDVLPLLLTGDGGIYFTAFKMHANKQPELKKLMSSLFGPDWMDKSTLDPNSKNPNAKYQVFATNGSAGLLAGGSFTHKGGKFDNIGGEYGGNKSVDVNVGDHTVDGVYSDLGVTVKDPNEITEFGGVKQVHEVEIIKGQVTINGITISAESGGSVTIIAIAGTINPVIYIEIPVGDNGIFRPSTAAPGEKVPYKYETNVEFIDLSKYYGSDYFFKEAGYDSSKTSTVIGDAYYESELINRTIREGLGYSGEVGADQIKTMLDNAISVKDNLGLELGKPLTPEQINNLEKDIIWYVEMEVDGEVVLVPQVYFGKETRLKMAEADQGGGVGSTVKAGGEITIDADSVTNVNGNIVGGGNVTIKSEGDITNNSAPGVNGGISGGSNVIVEAKGDVDMKGGIIEGGGEVQLKSGGNINIESGVGFDKDGKQVITNSGGILGGKDVKIESGGDTTIKGGVVGSTDGDVNVSGKNVKIEDINIADSNFKHENSAGSHSTESSSSSTSVGSSIGGKNVNIKAENDVTIKGSEVVAEKKLGIDAGNDVNIVDGQDYTHKTSEKTSSGIGSDGLLQIGSDSSEYSSSKSKGSTIGGVEGADIKSGGNITIKGSDVIGGEQGVNIESKGDVNIVDGQDSESYSSNSNHFTGVGVTIKEEKGKSTTSKGSGIITTGDLNINSGGNVKVVGSELTSVGDTNISASGDVKFEAGKNTSEHYSKQTDIGITKAGAGVAGGGAGASADWSSASGGNTNVVSGEAVDIAKDSQNMQAGKSGKMYGDSLANVTTTVGVSINESKEKSTTWTESEVTAGGNLNIKSKGTTDIGGADFVTGGDFNIEADKIDSTKFEDVVEKESSSINVGIKVDSVVTSGLNDAINQGMQIAEVAQDKDKDLNAGLVAGQVAGAASSVIFGDLINNSSSVQADIGVSKEKSKTTSENITEITSGGNINFKTTGGDINLKGVDIKGEKDVALDSAGNVNITDAKKTEQSSSSSTNVSAGVIASTGVSVIDGGYAQAGVVANVSHSKESKDNEYSQGSSITGNNITIKSKGDTNVIGSKVEGNNVDLDIGGNLKVETVTDKINEKTTQGQAGVDLQVGAATNTIGTGDIGVSAGGGTHWKEGEKVGDGQAGITAKDKFEGKVGGDANIIGGSIGSETGNGNLNVGGDLNISDVNANYKEGGEIINVSGGTKGGSIQGDIADKVEKDQTSKGAIGLNPDNIIVGGDVNINGSQGDKNNINTDIENTLITNKDSVQGGGTFGVQGSIVTPNKKDTPTQKSEVSENKQIPDLVLPDTEPPVKLPVPEFSGTDTVDGAIKDTKIPDLVLPDTEPPVKLPVPEFSGTDTVDGPVKDNSSTSSNKPPKHWEVNLGSGAVLTGGAIKSTKTVENLKKVVEELKGIREEVKENGSVTVKPPKPEEPKGDSSGPLVPKDPVQGNGYYKDENGKWQKGEKPNKNDTIVVDENGNKPKAEKVETSVSAEDNLSSNKPPKHWEVNLGSGAVLTGGGITSKKTVDNLKKVVDDLKEAREDVKENGGVTIKPPKSEETKGDSSGPLVPKDPVQGNGYYKDENGKWQKGEKPNKNDTIVVDENGNKHKVEK